MAEEKFVKPVRAVAVHLADGGSAFLEIGEPIELSKLAQHVRTAIEDGDPFTAPIFEQSSKDEAERWEAGLPIPPPKDFIRKLGSLELPQANEAGELQGQAAASEAESDHPTLEQQPEQPNEGKTEPEQPNEGKTEPEQPAGETEPEQPAGETEPEQPAGETEPEKPSEGETEPEKPSEGETEQQPKRRGKAKAQEQQSDEGPQPETEGS